MLQRVLRANTRVWLRSATGSSVKMQHAACCLPASHHHASSLAKDAATAASAGPLGRSEAGLSPLRMQNAAGRHSTAAAVATSACTVQAQAVVASHIIGLIPPVGLVRELCSSAAPCKPATPHHAATSLGHVELILGPMFAGKTTRLMRRCREAQAAGQSVLVLKSAKDGRYAQHALASHDGATLPCHATHSLVCVQQDLGPLFTESHFIAIDEGQFFPDLLEFVHLAADKLHKTVVIAALDGDFKRRRFGQVLDVLPLADVVHKLHARCFVPSCAHPAVFSMRTSADAGQELVGGRDMYVAACRQHYLQPADD